MAPCCCWTDSFTMITCGITSSVLVLLNSSLPGDPASRSLMSLKGDFLSVARSRDSEGDLESLTVPSGLGSE